MQIKKWILPALAFGLALAVRGETVTNAFGFAAHESYPIDDLIASGLMFAEQDLTTVPRQLTSLNRTVFALIRSPWRNASPRCP